MLAAGPTVADTMANAAFYFGLVRALAESERPLWSQMSFSAAEENFHVAAQHGIDAQVYWPGVGQVRVTELVLRRLLPLAHEGLEAWGASTGGARPAARDHRAALPAGTNGAEWFVDRMHQRGRPRPRTTRCARPCSSTASGMHTNEPVHTWDVTPAHRARSRFHSRRRRCAGRASRAG